MFYNLSNTQSGKQIFTTLGVAICNKKAKSIRQLTIDMADN